MYKKSKPLVGTSTAVFIGHKLHRLQGLVYTVFGSNASFSFSSNSVKNEPIKNFCTQHPEKI